ncbi:hypothetical protein [Paracoccus sp. SY]|uniref:hypothetical protein n=1 Tax=Paracoccus sp. SY TaxID=1330255 RepID=UPI000CCFE891|nr:hypothetical protein [Paracoccus sp. SY]
MQSIEHLNYFGQGMGALIILIGIVFGYLRGFFKGDGKPPLERPPAPHEVKQAISNLHSQIERTVMDEAVARDLLKGIAKLIIALEAAAEALDQNTEMSGDMRGDIREVSRDLRSLVTELLRAQIDGAKR